jgi:bifunctional DNase/RNase
MLEVRLSGVRVDRRTNAPVLLLEEKGGARRSLPIFVGSPEATAIALGIDKVPVPRPQTHDLLAILLGELGAHLERVVVTEVQGEIYFALLQLRVGDRKLDISCRPSDAVALAVRTDAPIFVDNDLMDDAGILLVNEEDDGAGDDPPEILLDRFKEFLDQVHPEDFSP